MTTSWEGESWTFGMSYHYSAPNVVIAPTGTSKGVGEAHSGRRVLCANGQIYGDSVFLYSGSSFLFPVQLQMRGYSNDPWETYATVDAMGMAQVVEVNIAQFVNPYAKTMALAGIKADGTWGVRAVGPGQAAFVDADNYPSGLGWYDPVDTMVGWEDGNSNGAIDVGELTGWDENNKPVSQADGEIIEEVPAGEVDDNVTPEVDPGDIAQRPVETVEINGVNYYRDQYGRYVGYDGPNGYVEIIPQNPTAPQTTEQAGKELQDIESNTKKIQESVEKGTSEITRKITESGEGIEQSVTEGSGDIVQAVNNLDENQNTRHNKLDQQMTDLNGKLDTGEGNPTIAQIINERHQATTSDSYKTDPNAADAQLTAKLQGQFDQLSIPMQTAMNDATGLSGVGNVVAPGGGAWPTFQVAGLTFNTDPFAAFPMLQTIGMWSREVILWLIAVAFVGAAYHHLEKGAELMTYTGNAVTLVGPENSLPGAVQLKHWTKATLFMTVLVAAYSAMLVAINSEISFTGLGSGIGSIIAQEAPTSSSPGAIGLMWQLVDAFVPLSAVFQYSVSTVVMGYILLPMQTALANAIKYTNI